MPVLAHFYLGGSAPIRYYGVDWPLNNLNDRAQISGRYGKWA
jgi:hypothetical protein